MLHRFCYITHINLLFMCLHNILYRRCARPGRRLRSEPASCRPAGATSKPVTCGGKLPPGPARPRPDIRIARRLPDNNNIYRQ